MSIPPLSAYWTRLNRRLREVRMIATALLFPDRPILAHIIPIRRCNLSCSYCNEYDTHSKPVPVETLKTRLDNLAELGTFVTTFSGGEPLLHPEIEALITHTRRRGMIAGVITNGYLLTIDRIRSLNAAGLDHMQISIDNVQPDAVSKKSLKVLGRKLEMLAHHASFHVNINSVLGGGIASPEDALTVARRAIDLGFTSTVGIIHDHEGQLRPLTDSERQVFLELKRLKKTNYSQLNSFQTEIAAGRPREWRCRAGARYLYVCEDGLVHYCSQQRGSPGKALRDYSVSDIKREHNTRKACAPLCTVSCAHQVSYLDAWRHPQTLEPSSNTPQLVQIGHRNGA